jgi:hypothetical protein
MPIATDPLSLLFIGCFLFGFLFVVVSAILGSGHGHGSHVMHTGHAGHVAHGPHVHVHAQAGSPTSARAVGLGHGNGRGPVAGREVNAFSLLGILNPMSLALFLLGFGFFGYVSHNTAAIVLPLTLVIAFLGGLLIAASLLWLIARLFGDSEGETIQDVSDRVGMLGKVSVPIREGNLGEILYISPGGMRKSVPARTLDGRRLERDQEVVIVNYQRGIAEVDTWDHFINRDDVPEEEKPDQDDLEMLRSLLENSEPSTKNTQIVLKQDAQKE